MASIFEELMNENRSLTEGVSRTKEKIPAKVTESAKKISYKKIRLESRRILEDVDDLGKLDDQFAVDPEESAEDEVVLVIDPELPADEEVPEDAAENMVGDSVYKCPVCGANYVCDCDAETESVEVDENGVPIECPICGDDTEQILIGEIAPAEGAGEETDLEPQEVEDDAEGEIPEEGDFDEYADDADFDEVNDDEYLEDSVKVPETVRREVKEDIDDATVPETCPECGEDPCICGDNGLTLDTPAVEDEEPAPAVEIDADVVQLTLDDGRFESMMTQMVRENYKFNPTFKITKVTSKGSQLKVEYLVRESKSKVTKGVMVAEGFSRKSRRMTLKFKDKGAFTESFTKTPSFVVECVRIRNKITPTKMSYNFTKRVNESLYRVSGKVDKSANFT